MNAAERLNRELQAIFDVYDATYRILVADIDGIPELAITTPNDYNIGAIANLLEYLRELKKCLITQLRLDTATGKWLTYMVRDIMQIARFEGESDADYVLRVQKLVIGPKISPAAIIDQVRQYSSPGPPQIQEGDRDGAFANVCFSDRYSTFRVESPETQAGHWITPAIALSTGSQAFTFILILENTPESKFHEIFEIVDAIKLAGVKYFVDIRTVV